MFTTHELLKHILPYNIHNVIDIILNYIYKDIKLDNKVIENIKIINRKIRLKLGYFNKINNSIIISCKYKNKIQWCRLLPLKELNYLLNYYSINNLINKYNINNIYINQLDEYKYLTLAFNLTI